MKIKFRELGINDIDFILKIENNKDNWKVSHTVEEFTKAEIENFIIKNTIDGLNDGQKRWIITANDEACGCIDLFDYNKKNKRAGIGIVLLAEMQNKGYASKALDVFIKFCKKDLELHQLYCTIIKDNTHSINLFISKGFIKTGERKEWTFYEEKYYDENFYQLNFQ